MPPRDLARALDWLRARESRVEELKASIDVRRAALSLLLAAARARLLRFLFVLCLPHLRYGAY